MDKYEKKKIKLQRFAILLFQEGHCTIANKGSADNGDDDTGLVNY